MTDQYKATITKWNRKLHMYLGLYMLLFLWLFSISGLIMNHPDWFTHKPNRSATEHPVQMPDLNSNIENAKDIMNQLNISGEIIFRGKQRPGQFAFIAMRPNERYFVNINLKTRIAKVNTVNPQTAAVIGVLHTFSGVRGIWGESKENSQRDWLPTVIWSFSMDALCVGLIFMVISSLYMALQIKQNRTWCIVSFALGTLICSFFLWGLA